MNRSVYNGKPIMFLTPHRYTQRVRKIASAAVLIILVYIVTLFLSAISPQ